jgi:cytochrome c-type protein NapC
VRLSRTVVLPLLAAFAAGIAFAVLGNAALEQTNSNEFCTSCHSMGTVTAEYRQSLHFNNASGVRAMCADCHVPHSLGPMLKAKVLATKDLYHELAGTIDTVEKFEARRWHLANVVWDKMAATDSRECRSCHTDGAMELALQERRVARRHQRAEEEGETCIECHKGVAHTEPLPPLAAD